MSLIAPPEYASRQRSSAPVDVDGPRRRGLRVGQRISGLVVNGRALYAPVYNENEVRAAAGLTMVIGAVAFSYAYFDHLFLPLKIVTSFFLVEFLIRVTIGFQFSPIRVVAWAMTRSQSPDWVSAKPKRFAWTLGLLMATAMTVITNSGIRGTHRAPTPSTSASGRPGTSIAAGSRGC